MRRRTQHPLRRFVAVAVAFMVYQVLSRIVATAAATVNRPEPTMGELLLAKGLILVQVGLDVAFVVFALRKLDVDL